MFVKDELCLCSTVDLLVQISAAALRNGNRCVDWSVGRY